MPWGRVDDGFYDHPKLDRLGKDRMPAAGLYWVAVSWCNRWLTDGLVPRDRVTRLGGSIRLAELLVDAELWEREGRDYRVHDFLEFNDSREVVEANREAEREKKRRQRAAGSAAVTNGEGGKFVSRQASLGLSPGDTRRDSRGESPATRPVPSRPSDSGSTTPSGFVDPRAPSVPGSTR